MSGSPARTRSRSFTVKVLALGDQVFLGLAHVRRDDHLPLALGVLAEVDLTIDLGDDGGPWALRASKSSATRQDHP